MELLKKVFKHSSIKLTKTVFVFILITVVKFDFNAQVFSTDDLLKFPFFKGDDLSEFLEKKGWEKYNYEIVKDSNFVRRTWRYSNKTSGTDSYFAYYEFTKDTMENYIVYQFSDRKSLDIYRSELKNKGYKMLKAKKTNKKDETVVNNEKEENYYHEKKQALFVVKEVFLYGLNSFLIYSYKPKSAIVKHIIQSKGK